ARLANVEWHALAPFHVDHIDDQAMAAAQIGPQVRELTEDGDQDLVTWRKRIGHRRLPAAGARCREEEHLPGLGLEDLLQVADERQSEGRKIRSALVLERNVHGLADAEGHVGGSWNEKSMEAGHWLDLRYWSVGVDDAMRVGPRVLQSA